MKRVLLFTFILFSVSSRAQWFVGVKFMGISYHLDDGENKKLYQWNVGRHGNLAFHIGFGLTCEYKINNWFSLKVDQVVFRDCAGRFAGMSMFNARGTLDMKRAGDISAGMGPFFYYRRSWLCFEKYKNDGYFKSSKNGKWQTKFVWYGGEIEYNFPINETLDWSTNILPGLPVVIAVASGVRTQL